MIRFVSSTSFCEIYQAEMMGFCADGEGGAFVGSGATSLGGRLPINLSGGLVSKGHPVGATGLSMIHELALQLRGAVSLGDVNKIAATYHWSGMRSDQARAA